MKSCRIILLLLALGISPLMAQIFHQYQGAPPRELTGLAIRFSGILENTPVDTTVTANGTNPADQSLNIQVFSVAKSNGVYLVNYVANRLLSPQANPSALSPGYGPSGCVVLTPGRPLTVVKSASTNLTLTLTELPPTR